MRSLWVMEILKAADKKLPGIPQPMIDRFCSRKNIKDKKWFADYLYEKTGVSVIGYEKTLEYEFERITKRPRYKVVKNSPSRYPYYSFFTKDRFFLPMSQKIWNGHDMDGDSHWERFCDLFNEAMNAGWIPYKSPYSERSLQSAVRLDDGEVVWESDDILTLISNEMRHYREHPFVDNPEWVEWERLCDEYVREEMKARGYVRENVEPDFEEET